MGTISSRKCREVVKNTEIVIAIELLCGAQALDLFTNVKPGEGTLAAYNVIRNAVSHMDNDRILSTDIDTVKQLMRSGTILKAVENKVGKLR
jgi:histidine ammonia-lyase